MFLTDDELFHLTGYKLPGWQVRWLKAHTWRFEVSAIGRPVVARAYAEQRLCGSQPATSGVALNLEAIRKRA